jgi:hypothetical protein
LLVVFQELEMMQALLNIQQGIMEYFFVDLNLGIGQLLIARKVNVLGHFVEVDQTLLLID